MTEVTGMRWCWRCQATVPLNEWRMAASMMTLRHTGRDRRLLVGDTDEDGSVECGAVDRIPQNTKETL